MSKTPLLYIARDGNWGDADGLRFLPATSNNVVELGNMSDAQITEYGHKHGVPYVLPVTVSDLIGALEAYEGDNLDVFIDTWTTYLTGVDTPCAEAADGLHQVSDGSCDLCGDKNRN